MVIYANGESNLTTSPSNEWQDRVSSMLDARAVKSTAGTRTNQTPRSVTHANTNAVASSSPDPSASHTNVSISGNNPNPQRPHQDDYAATGRRTRRRVGEAEYDMEDDQDPAGSTMYSAGQERERADNAFRADRDRDSNNANANM